VREPDWGCIGVIAFIILIWALIIGVIIIVTH